MSRLFLRIFLWFWLVAGVIVVALVAGSPFLTRTHPRLDRWQERAETAVRRVAEETANGVERGEIRPHCPHRRRHPRTPFELFVVDETGRDTGGRPVPRELLRLARDAREGGGPRVERLGTLYASAHPAVTPDGRTLVVVAAVRRPPRVVDLLAPRTLLPRLAVLLLVVGVLAFALARRITTPLETLRTATRRLAAGDLEARVGSPLTRRRDEIGELARDFDTMAGRLQALLESQRRLLRDVSHELRSPLARIGVALELARRGDPGEREAALDRIGLETERLDGMIAQILTLARLEEGMASVIREPVPLGPLLDTVLEDARFEARRRGITVEYRDEGSPCTVAGDRSLLRSAVENVLRNAVRYAAEGGTVSVSVQRVDELVEIAVADDGPGVPDADLAHLFEPFFRTGNARDRASGGAGLGLAITAAAVRAHGGAVTAANLPGGGLEIRILLPCSSRRS